MGDGTTHTSTETENHTGVQGHLDFLSGLKRQREQRQKVGWICEACTFINHPRRPGCEQCSAERPLDYQIPDDCPPNEEEVRRMALENERLFREVSLFSKPIPMYRFQDMGLEPLDYKL